MDDSSDVDKVLERFRAGDPLAAELLISRFSGQLCRLARDRLGLRYRRKIDPEDIVQSVFKSFIRMESADALSFDNWDALWGFLSLITIRKCGHRIDYLRAARRSVAREHSAGPADGLSLRPGGELQVFSRDPTPSHVAMLAETIERLLEPLGERDRRIATLALEGHDTTEISGLVARSERTVQRVLKGIRERLREAIEQDG